MFASTKTGVPATLSTSGYFVGSAVGTTSVSLTGLSLVQNDIVILLTGYSDNSAIVPGPTTSGYTQAALLTSIDPKIYVGYKVMGSTPDTVVDVTPARDSRGTNTIAYAWRNIDTTTPLLTSAVTSTSSGVPFYAPEITFSGEGIVIATGLRDTQTATGIAVPANMSNFRSQTVSPGGVNSLLVVAGARANGGFSPMPFGVLSSALTWVAVTLALKLA